MTKWKYTVMPFYKTQCFNLFTLGNRVYGTFIYRYMNMERALEWLTNNEIVFSSPANWDDEYDMAFCGKNLNPVFGNFDFLKQELYGCCFSTEGNNEAVLKTYIEGGDDKKGVCVKLKLNRRNFYKELSRCVKIYANETKIYECKMNYGCNLDTVRKAFADRKGKYYNEASKGFCHDTFISLLSLKRKAFSYEHEVRYYLESVTNGEDTRIHVKDFQWSNVIETIEVDCSSKKGKDEYVGFVSACSSAGLKNDKIEKLNIYELKEI